MTVSAEQQAAELAELLAKLDKACHGHPYALNIIALIRMIAVMMSPADRDTRKKHIKAIPKMLHELLEKIDSEKPPLRG